MKLTLSENPGQIFDLLLAKDGLLPIDCKLCVCVWALRLIWKRRRGVRVW